MPDTDGVTAEMSADMASAEREFVSAYLAAALTAAWMRRCGPSGTPGDWMIPGEFIEIGEVRDITIEAYPLWAYRKELNGRVTGWSAHTRSNFPAWEWRLDTGWDDCTQNEIEALEDLGGCFDDRRVSFLAEGSHDEPPPITDELIDALMVLRG